MLRCNKIALAGFLLAGASLPSSVRADGVPSPPRSVAPPWAAALARCAPGAKMDACLAALGEARVPFSPPNAPPGSTRVTRINLAAPWLLVEIRADKDAGDRVSTARFKTDMRPEPKKDRKQVLDWLTKRFHATPPRDAKGNLGCGASSGGPAWFGAAAGMPEVQFAVETFPTERGGSGRPMDEVILRTKSDEVNLCFLLPPSSGGGFSERAPLAEAMADFVTDRAFHGRTKPTQ